MTILLDLMNGRLHNMNRYSNINKDNQTQNVQTDHLKM